MSSSAARRQTTPEPHGKVALAALRESIWPAVEHRLAVVERVSRADLCFLDRLHVREALVVLELPNGLAQEPVRAELVVAVARLDVATARDAPR